MPHKHTRRENDPKDFNLPPTQIAQPLPVDTVSKRNAQKKRNTGIAIRKEDAKRKRTSTGQNDAPRAFKRLMAFAEGQKLRDGLDDGNSTAPQTKKKKKRRRKVGEIGTSDKTADSALAALDLEATAQSTKAQTLMIMPHEKLSDFARRVDKALPLSGLMTRFKTRDGKDPASLKVWRTHKERQMHKLYDEWRLQERKIQERREEEAEFEEEKALEEEMTAVGGVSLRTAWADMEKSKGGRRGKKKKGKKRHLLGEVGDKEEDPWAVLKKNREGKIGLNDVAQAPPELKALKSEFLVRAQASVEVGDIPKTAGSLRQREELHSIRSDVVASYRQLMSATRNAPSAT